MLQIFGIERESITDGPGIRYAIYTQGCPHYCEGCHNPESHAFGGGVLMDSQKILEEIFSNPLLDGVTFSGGEPFMQAEELAYIAGEVRKRGLSVIAYSGYTFEELLSLSEEREGYTELLSHTDVLIDGKFEIAKKSMDLRYRGSSNQLAIDVQKSLEIKKKVLYPL